MRFNPSDEERRRLLREASHDPSMAPRAKRAGERLVASVEERNYARAWDRVRRKGPSSLRADYLELVSTGALARSGRDLVRDLVSDPAVADWLSEILYSKWSGALSSWSHYYGGNHDLSGTNAWVDTQGSLNLDVTLTGVDDPEHYQEDLTSWLEDEDFAPSDLIDVDADHADYEGTSESVFLFKTPFMRHHLIQLMSWIGFPNYTHEALIDQIRRDREEDQRKRTLGRKREKRNPPLTKAQWDELVRLLLDENWTYRQAAAHFDVVPQAISAHLKRYRPYALRVYRKRRGYREIR